MSNADSGATAMMMLMISACMLGFVLFRVLKLAKGNADRSPSAPAPGGAKVG